MKYIYYPEYELEYSNLLRGSLPNHTINIRVLMFLCDHVILPPSHLLYMSSKNILELITNLHEFFSAGKIITTLYQGGIDNYFSSRIDRIKDPIARKAKVIQVEQIKNGLFNNPNVIHNKSDEKVQLSLFDTRIKELIRSSNTHKSKSLILLEHMDSISNQSGEPVYSSQFRDMLTALSQNRDITSSQNSYFHNLMSNAYYFSGTYTMNTPVSYNSYFERIDLQNNLIGSHATATNLIINPYFLHKLFEVLGIKLQDINRLGPSEYDEIKSQKFWNDFLAVFNNIYTSSLELDDLLRNRKLLAETYKRRKEVVFKVIDIFASDVILSLLLNPAPCAVNIGVPLVISLLKGFFSPMTKFEQLAKKYTVDKFMDAIIRNRDPLYEFSYRLNAMTNLLAK